MEIARKRGASRRKDPRRARCQHGGASQTWAVENLVDLSRHDEVILVQSLYFLCLQADGRIAPAEADVRMMAFGLSEFTDLLDKGHCFAKVAEPEGPLDTMSVVAEFPVRGLRTDRSASS